MISPRIMNALGICPSFHVLSFRDSSICICSLLHFCSDPQFRFRRARNSGVLYIFTRRTLQDDGHRVLDVEKVKDRYRRYKTIKHGYMGLGLFLLFMSGYVWVLERQHRATQVGGYRWHLWQPNSPKDRPIGSRENSDKALVGEPGVLQLTYLLVRKLPSFCFVY